MSRKSPFAKLKFGVFGTSLIPRSSNGRTPAFGAENRGSNPCRGTSQITDEDYIGKWKVFFFWPKDFTFVCPTEIAAFAKLNNGFADRDAQILGGSTDSEFVHLAWRENHEDLRDLPFPMLADIKRELTAALGILDPSEGAVAAVFKVEPVAVAAPA